MKPLSRFWADKMQFDSMNETDVREIVVRPLLARLGYSHGTRANIRTEVSLKYNYAFLGRKNPGKDPPLKGRADYICDAISYARWTVEVKSPQHKITQEDVDQAHTYSAHPEIAASYILVTNGREFRLYVASRLDQPILLWQYEDTDQHLPALFNILGYEGLKRHSRKATPDVNKPLAKGLNSAVAIVGGTLTYGQHRSDHPLFQGDGIDGMTAAVLGKDVTRTSEGLISAKLEIASAFSYWTELNKLSGIDGYDFACADEFISTDKELPSIFQNITNAVVQPGFDFKMPAVGTFKLPFGLELKAYTQAVGFVQGDCFKGVFEIEYEYSIFGVYASGIPQLDFMIQSSPRVATMHGEGIFELRIRENLGASGP